MLQNTPTWIRGNLVALLMCICRRGLGGGRGSSDVPRQASDTLAIRIMLQEKSWWRYYQFLVKLVIKEPQIMRISLCPAPLFVGEFETSIDRSIFNLQDRPLKDSTFSRSQPGSFNLRWNRGWGTEATNQDAGKEQDQRRNLDFLLSRPYAIFTSISSLVAYVRNGHTFFRVAFDPTVFSNKSRSSIFLWINYRRMFLYCHFRGLGLIPNSSV